ncbi:MAG: LysR family transcriptional regulator [Oscillospiraceae bacterium]
MNLQQIEYAVAVAQEKSFSKAAKRLFVTQPALSQVISKLENQLGIKIFDRSTTPLQITHAGNVFLKHAREIVMHNEQMQNELAAISDFKSGTLNIASTPFTSSCIIIPCINIFRNKFSNIDVCIYDSCFYNLGDMLINGTADIAISPGKFTDELFDCEPLFHDTTYIAVCENNPINRRLSDFRLSANDIKNKTMRYFSAQSVDISEFRNEKFILHKSRYSNNELKKIFGETFGFTPDIPFHANHIETIYSFMLSGMGVVFVPELFIKYSNICYHGVYYKVNSPKQDINIISKKGKPLPRSAEEYIAILKHYISQLP